MKIFACPVRAEPVEAQSRVSKQILDSEVRRGDLDKVTNQVERGASMRKGMRRGVLMSDLV